MKLIIIFGPQAVGKMTVGQELEKQTDLKLFHNHMTIDLLHPFFGFSSETWRLSDLIRSEIFKAIAKSKQTGMIFTYVWAFNMQEDWDFVNTTCNIFESEGWDVCFVELEADLVERIERNKSENRLLHKPTKRNIEESEQELRSSLDKYRLNSLPGEMTRDNYIKINNTHLTPEQVATLIKAQFNL